MVSVMVSGWFVPGRLGTVHGTVKSALYRRKSVCDLKLWTSLVLLSEFWVLPEPAGMFQALFMTPTWVCGFSIQQELQWRIVSPGRIVYDSFMSGLLRHGVTKCFPNRTQRTYGSIHESKHINKLIKMEVKEQTRIQTQDLLSARQQHYQTLHQKLQFLSKFSPNLSFVDHFYDTGKNRE